MKPTLLNAQGKDEGLTIEQRVEKLEKRVRYLEGAAMFTGTFLTLLKRFFDQIPMQVKKSDVQEEHKPDPPKDVA